MLTKHFTVFFVFSFVQLQSFPTCLTNKTPKSVTKFLKKNHENKTGLTFYEIPVGSWRDPYFMIYDIIPT